MPSPRLWLPNGQNWTLVGDTGQTSGAAPALALSLHGSDVPRLNWNLLVLVFVANDPSNRILYSILDLNDDPNTRGWRYVGQVGGESAQAVSTLVGPAPEVVVYFTANDPSNRILVHSFVPYPLPSPRNCGNPQRELGSFSMTPCRCSAANSLAVGPI
jgi:hypothetical protein